MVNRRPKKPKVILREILPMETYSPAIREHARRSMDAIAQDLRERCLRVEGEGVAVAIVPGTYPAPPGYERVNLTNDLIKGRRVSGIAFSRRVKMELRRRFRPEIRGRLMLFKREEMNLMAANEAAFG